MKKLLASVTIHIEVLDPQVLWDKAVEYARDGDVFADDEVAAQVLGSRDDPHIAECLRMLIDPGVSPEGTQIIDSSVDLGSWEGEDAE